jgi:hypothetical protein
MALGFFFNMVFLGQYPILTIFIMSWLNSFYDPEKGPIKDKDYLMNVF